MKLPNGFGSVVKMGGHRRKPYVVRKTAGWEYDSVKDKMIQKYEIIGYAATKKEGLEMLTAYNENPYDTKAAKLTFSEIYDLWKADKFKSIGKSSVTNYKAAYAACAVLYNERFAELKLADLQRAIDVCGKNYPTLRNVKVLLNQLYDFAIKNDVCNKNYAEYVDILKYKERNPNRRPRTRISKEDVDILWHQKDDPYYQVILMLIYNGCRVMEFLNLKKENVNLSEQYFDVILSKTENGIRRVPIADAVLPFYQQWYGRHAECEYLICTPDGKRFAYRNYYDSYFLTLMEQLNMKYTPHFTRHTTASMMADAGIDPTVQKKILGHSGAMTMTERVYTHLDLQVLIDAVNRICTPPDKNA